MLFRRVPRVHGEGSLAHGKQFAVGGTRQAVHGRHSDGEGSFALCHLSRTQQTKVTNGARTETGVDGAFAVCLSGSTRRRFELSHGGTEPLRRAPCMEHTAKFEAHGISQVFSSEVPVYQDLCGQCWRRPQ